MKVALVLALFLGFAGLVLAENPAPPPPTHWWQGGRWKRPEPNPKAKLLPLIVVQGNHFARESGETILFRGVSIADPDKLVGQGRWNRELFVAVKDLGANLVRLPVHPAAWRERGVPGYLALLDQAVDWCTDLGLYVDIDWHSIGNLHSGMFQSPMYDTSQAETFAFWRTIAAHFQGNHTVAFYELFNEPTHFNGMLGSMSWTQWRELNEEMIAIIRYWDKERIPLVAGFDWAYDLNPLHYEPVHATGIGYVTHPYANKRSQPWEPKWEENFAFAAATYPVIATEIGFGLREGEVVNDEHYGNRITRFLERHGISWLAWVYDPEWGPPMLKSFDGYTLTGAGEFFKEAMHRPPAAPESTPKKEHAP
ncbi:MAG TPA: cellulase family glycosylhydrolase [Candidatus Didemnitutus sp.]|nr:cellulase family glycosylhydrolase [Candidatus Didemnitutus sp.]